MSKQLEIGPKREAPMSVVAYAAERMISGTLDQLAVNLQLGETQFARATQSYSGATTWLAAEGSSLYYRSPYLFPQGSLALDTTVRPILTGEFDLDVICRVDMSRLERPERIYDLIWDRMKEHNTYRPLMERMPRCIRLNYAEESHFHLDVVPAIPDVDRGGTFILIPDGSGDGDRMTWKSANPQGFYTWFQAQKIVSSITYAKSHVEPLAQLLPAESKAVLTKCVQLLKRWRDVRWVDDPDCSTPSIVITYLVAWSYQGETAIASAFDGILDNLVRFVNDGEKKIVNPVNDHEVISEKWLRKPACYRSFTESIRQLRTDWDEVLEISGDDRRGIPAFTEKMKELFGEPAVASVKSAIHQPVEAARPAKSIFIDKRTGQIAASAGAAVAKSSHASYRPQTFYGD